MLVFRNGGEEDGEDSRFGRQNIRPNVHGIPLSRKTPRGGCGTRLLSPNRPDRIDLHCSPRREAARQNRNTRQKHRDAGGGERVGR